MKIIFSPFLIPSVSDTNSSEDCKATKSSMVKLELERGGCEDVVERENDLRIEKVGTQKIERTTERETKLKNE